MIELANTIIEGMPGAYGTSNVQCFSTAAGDLKGIETNSQLTGGYPPPDHAGAPGTKWLIEKSLAGSRRSRSKAGEDGPTMLLDGEAAFIPRGTNRHSLSCPPCIMFDHEGTLETSGAHGELFWRASAEANGVSDKSRSGHATE
jgi:hypothetical protein